MKHVVKKFLPFLFLAGPLIGAEQSEPTIMESIKENPSQFFQVERLNRPKPQIVEEKKKTPKDIFFESPYLYGSILLLFIIGLDVLIIKILLKRTRKKNAPKISLR